MKKPLIGICASLSADGLEQKLYTNYINACDQADLLPFIFPYQIDKADIVSYMDTICGVLICGGVDVNPAYYNEAAHEKLGEVNAWRDRLEMDIIAEATLRGMPILGICRGFQILNVALKGSLLQDIPAQLGVSTLHQGADNTASQHSCEVVPDTPAARWFYNAELTVNTFHHQGIKLLGEGLLPSVFAPDGLIEAFYSEKYPNIIAVQWHPEKEMSIVSKRIFSDFHALCKSYAERQSL